MTDKEPSLIDVTSYGDTGLVSIELTNEELKGLKELIENSKDIEPEIVDMVNRKFSKLLLKLD